MPKSRNQEQGKSGLKPTRKFSIAEMLSAVLSVTFLVLAVYIAIFSMSARVRDPQQSTDLLCFAAVVGSYGIWRMVRTLLKNREENT